LALLTFGIVSSFTPGRNNLMLMASAANFGVARSLPHLAGIIIGFFVMTLVVGIGLFSLFQAWPPSMTVLKVVGIAYTLWLAWKIARASAPGTGNGEGRPMTFLQACAFQWVNPKAWTMGLTAITLYLPDDRFFSILLLALIFAVIGIASTSSWMLMGRAISGWLSSPRRLHAYNYGMAALLVGSIALAL
jgi:threonine/homoserine/homoserine lactone efflux protein